MPISERTSVIKKTFSSNPAARRGIIIIAVCILAMLLFGLWGVLGSSKRTANTATALPGSPDVNNIPGGSKFDPYNKVQAQDNLDRQRKAEEQGETNIPTLTGEVQMDTSNPFGELAPSSDVPQGPVDTTVDVEEEPPPPVVGDPVVASDFSQTPPLPEINQPPVYVDPPPPAYDVEAYRDAVEKKRASVQQQIVNYLEMWSVAPEPFYGSPGGIATEDRSGASAPSVSGGQGAAGVSSRAGAPSSAEKGPSLVRAGTVIPAVLVTSANSDSPGPMVAHIVSGPFKGAKLLGEFKLANKKIVIQFDRMVSPSIGSYGINAFAVNEDYSVGMASKVNNHYFRRYGLSLASSFIAAWGQAAGRANSTITNGPLGTSVTYGEQSTDQIRKQAIGEAGGQLGKELGKAGDIDATVTLSCRRGCPIGVLFMADL